MRILVLDNYDSFVYNIVQHLGALGADVTIVRNNQITLEDIERMSFDGIIISPGPGNPASSRYFGVCGDVILHLGSTTPILGICLGHQGIAHFFGGRVARASRLMHGKTSLVSHEGEGVFEGLRNPLRVMRYHSLVVKELPPVLKVTAYSLDDWEIMGLKHASYPIEGVQFHPESILTDDGMRLIANFLKGCRR